MKEFTIYEIDSGKIVRTGYCQDGDFFSQAIGIGETIIEGNFPQNEYYFQQTKPIRRPRMGIIIKNLANKGEKYVKNISNLPVSGLISVTGHFMEIPTDNLTIEIDKGHTTMLKVTKFPFQAFETLIQQDDETIVATIPSTLIFN